MFVVSDMTKEKYYEEECVFFRNCIQSARYIEWGAKLMDLFVDGKGKLVFVFTKEDHNKYKVKWGKSKPPKTEDEE